MDQAEHDVARSVLSDAQCGTVGAQPAETIAEVAHEAKIGDTNERSLLQNLGVAAVVISGLVAAVLLSWWALQRKGRSAEKS